MSVGAESASAAVAPTPPSSRRRGLFWSSSVGLAIGIVAYRILLDFAYRALVATPFAYQGFKNAPTVGGILVSWLFLLTLLPLLLRVLRCEKLSAQITSLLVLVSLVPTTTLIAHDPRYTVSYVALIFLYWLLFLLACVFLPTIQPFRRPLRSEMPHLVVLGVLSATILFLSWRFTGFRLHFGLFDIYDLRAEARAFRVATIFGYFATIADNTLPILLAFYLRRRWFVVAAAVAVVILFNYGISATKQVLFLLMFALASVAVGEPARLNRKILVALTAVISLGIIEHRVLGTLFVGTLSLYRLMFIPAHLHWVHYEFFQNNELLYLTQSALRFFFESPYRENIQFILGEFYIGDFTARANNGLFSDAYMNFGAASVLFYPVLAVFLLKLVEGASKGLPSSVQLMLVVSLSFAFLGLPLPTAILSAGVGVLVVLLSTLPRGSRAGRLAVAVPA